MRRQSQGLSLLYHQMDKAAIQNRLVALRGEKTLAEFAGELNSTPQNVYRYETGRMPSGDFLRALADKAINVNWLLTGEGPVHIPKPTGKVAAICREAPEGENAEENVALVESMQVPLVGELAVLDRKSVVWGKRVDSGGRRIY